MLRTTGNDPQEVCVLPGTTMAELKEQHNLKGYQFYYKAPLKDANTIEHVGITAGETLHAWHTACTAKNEQNGD